MERDFMGLSAKDPVILKEESVDGDYHDYDLARSTGVLWSLSNKAAALHNLMSLKPDQDKKPSEMNSALLASQGHMLKYGSDIFVPKHEQQLGDFQNFDGAHMKQQFPGRNPFVTHPVLPSGEFLAGTSKPCVRAQLTIFYGGTVSVFNDISPEKAQAIAFLAGNVCVPCNMAQSKLHSQTPVSKSPPVDQVMLNQNMPQGSGLPSSLPVSSHSINHSGVLAANNDAEASQTVGMVATLVNKADLPSVMSSIGTMMSSALPQARRASLARFLEKRKERVMNAAPYKQSIVTLDCVTSGSNDLGFSTTSAVDSNSTSISNM